MHAWPDTAPGKCLGTLQTAFDTRLKKNNTKLWLLGWRDGISTVLQFFPTVRPKKHLVPMKGL